MKNYYELLEVNPKASKEVIKKVFKYKIKQNHPDLFTGDEKIVAEEKVKDLNIAYEILSDDEKRKNYDLEIKNEYESEYTNIIENLKNENTFLKEKLMASQNIINQFLMQNEENYSNYNNYSNEKQNNTTLTSNNKTIYYKKNSKISGLKNLFFKLMLTAIIILLGITIIINLFLRPLAFSIFGLIY